MDRGYLYSVTNKIGNFIYIGITNNIGRRITEHRTSSHVKAIQLENVNNLIFTTLCIGSYKFVSEMERSLIKKYRELDYPIVNISDGGEYPTGMPGETHWNAQLSEDQAILIRELYASGKYTGRTLSSIFNTGYKNISKIVRGERWSHVGGPITLIKPDISKVANRAKILPEEVPFVREEALNRFLIGELNIPEFAKELGIARQNLRLLLIGKTWSKLDGPILKQDYWEDFGRGS